MTIHSYSRKEGHGSFSGWAYVALGFKIRGETPEDIERMAVKLTSYFDSIVRNNPEIQDLETVSECIDCFMQSISAAEGQSDQ